MVSAFGTAISITHGNCDGGVVNNRDGARRGASRRLLRRLLCPKFPPRYRTHHTEGSTGPPGAVYGQGFNKGRSCVVSDEIGCDRHGSCTREADISHQPLFTYVKRTMQLER